MVNELDPEEILTQFQQHFGEGRVNHRLDRVTGPTDEDLARIAAGTEGDIHPTPDFIARVPKRT